MKYRKTGYFLRNAAIEIKIAVILFCILSVFVVALAVVFVVNNNKPQSVDVINFDQVSNAPEIYKNGVQDMMGALIGKNENIPDDVLYKAVIRDGSYYEEKLSHATTSYFLVDVEELRYSFEVTVSWPSGELPNDDDLGIIIRCPYYTDVIYPETQCIAESPEAQIERYLPNNYVLAGGHRVHIDKSYFGGEFQLLVQIDACKNQTLMEEALNYANEWIKSIYLDPNSYNLEPYDTCLMSFLDSSQKNSIMMGEPTRKDNSGVL